MHDRKATEESIVAAVDRIILKQGFSGMKVNQVAREAGVSKVLIYRYFGDFNGLLEQWALKNSYWMELSHVSTDVGDVKKGFKDFIDHLSGSLLSSPAKREVLRWLLAEDTPVGKNVMRKLEERGVDLMREVTELLRLDEPKDFEAVLAVLTAGVNYLALLSDRADVYNGIPLDTKEGWERISDAFSTVLTTMISANGTS